MTQTSLEIVDPLFLADVLSGLSSSPKKLPCKYFYDKAGSLLFDQICELDEYYLTRVETSILENNIDEIAAELGKNVLLIEFGSGSSVKTEWLLETLTHPAGYVPVDVSEKHLNDVANKLRIRFPEIEILPLVADFNQPLQMPQSSRLPDRRTIFFPGSTIGNLDLREANQLLQRIHDELGPEGGLLIGIDLQKDPDIIAAAYNDKAGVTAQFNLNLLHRINRELGGDFDVGQFEHSAVYNEDLARIETHIVSSRQQTVSVDGHTFEFQKDETILTEYSHKYTIDRFCEWAGQAGFQLQRSWTDENQWFALLYLTAVE